MRHADVTAISVVGSITSFGVAVGLIMVANHPELPFGCTIGGTSLLTFSISTLLVTCIRAANRPRVRIATKVTDINPRSATDTVTLSYQADGLDCVLRLPRAAFVALPRENEAIDVILLAHDSPFVDVRAYREVGDDGKPPGIAEV